MASCARSGSWAAMASATQEPVLELQYFCIQTFRQNGFIRQLISYDNVFQVQCQNAKMYKNRYRNLDKIPVLHFDQ